MIYYKCQTTDGRVLWQEIDAAVGAALRLMAADGTILSSGAILVYQIVSTDQALWPLELLPAYRTRKHEALAANYVSAAARDYTSSALGAPYAYPATVVDKLYMAARNTQALVMLATAASWRPSAPVAAGGFARPTIDNGWAYRCTVAGTSGAGEPAWPTTQDATVTDGTVTWQAWHKWTGEFACTDGGGVNARRPHSYQQMMQVGLDGVAHFQGILDRRDALAALIDAAATLAALDAIDLTL